MLPVPRHCPRRSRRQVGHRGEVEQAPALVTSYTRLCVRKSSLLRVSGACCRRPGGSKSPTAGHRLGGEQRDVPGGNRVPSAWAIASASWHIGTGSVPARWKHSPMPRAAARSGPALRSCRRCRSDAARPCGGRWAGNGAEDRPEEREKMEVARPVDKPGPGDDSREAVPPPAPDRLLGVRLGLLVDVRRPERRILIGRPVAGHPEHPRGAAVHEPFQGGRRSGSSRAAPSCRSRASAGIRRPGHPGRTAARRGGRPPRRRSPRRGLRRGR